MPQYVNRKRRKKRRKIKVGAVALAVVAAIIICALIATAVVLLIPKNNTPTGSNSAQSGTSTSESFNASSNNVSSEPIPESSSTTIVSYESYPNYDSSATLGGNYLDVGNRYICEVVSWEAETFSSESAKDISKPTLSPLPVGTVDYCSGTLTHNGKPTSSNEYKVSATLRYGRRIFTESLHIQRSKIYDVADYGELPETNNVTILSGGLSSDKRYSILKLDVDWKAPFTLDIKPQSYTNSSDSDRDFSITAATYTYIDITFCYSSKTITNDIERMDFTNTIFSSAEWRKNTSDYTLRLYLKNEGGAYGWFAEYDSNDNLVFYFLNPAKISVSGGSTNLSGIRVFLDVGHGGVDSGAIGKYNGNTYYESNMNLALANEVKTKLEALGATVIMSRETDVQISSVELMQKIRDSRADISISIHHDSGGSRGCGVFYYHPMSALAAKYIKNETNELNLYSRTYSGWHVYYGGRVMHCPTILTENGFMDSTADMQIILNENEKRSKAIVDGVVEYFKALNGLE